jgi:hypothetical protein
MDYTTSTGAIGSGAKPIADLFEAVKAVIDKNVGKDQPAVTFTI